MSELNSSNGEISYQTKVEATLNLIPIVGGSISTLIFGHQNSIKLKRLEVFCKDVALQIENTQTYVNKDFEPYLSNLTEKVIEVVQKEALQDKQNMLKNIYVSILKNQNIELYDSQAIFIRALESFTPMDIYVLDILFKEKDNFQVVEDLIEKQDIELNNELFLASLNKMKSYAFTTYIAAPFLLNGGHSKDGQLLEKVQIVSLGLSFIDYAFNTK